MNGTSFCSLRTATSVGLLLFLAAAGRAGTAAATPPTDAAPLPVAVAPSDPNVRYEGRFDTHDPASPACSWPASTVHLRVDAAAVNVRLNDSDSDFYQIVVDGKPADVLTTHGGSHLYRIFTAPAAGTHTIDLVKRTESFFGIGRFEGFQLSSSGRLLALAPRPTRRIEVIGDSISCGYGNEGANQNEHFSAKTENGYLAYGAVAARMVGAEYVCIAWSGRTMWPRDAPKDATDWPKNTMGEIYDLTLATDPSSRWDFSRWTPDVVVVTLGTNDFNGGVPDEKTWTAQYERFLDRVRSHYPKAAIYCATSPMMWGDGATTLKTYLTKIVQDETTAGHANVRLLEFATQDAANGIGADWHPSVKTDQIMARKMADALQKDLGWTPTAGR